MRWHLARLALATIGEVLAYEEAGDERSNFHFPTDIDEYHGQAAEEVVEPVLDGIWAGEHQCRGHLRPIIVYLEVGGGKAMEVIFSAAGKKPGRRLQYQIGVDVAVDPTGTYKVSMKPKYLLDNLVREGWLAFGEDGRYDSHRQGDRGDVRSFVSRSFLANPFHRPALRRRSEIFMGHSGGGYGCLRHGSRCTSGKPALVVPLPVPNVENLRDLVPMISPWPRVFQNPLAKIESRPSSVRS